MSDVNYIKCVLFLYVNCLRLRKNFENIDGKKYLNNLDLGDFWMNQTFPRFSQTCFALEKAREILIYQKFVQIQVVLISLPPDLGCLSPLCRIKDRIIKMRMIKFNPETSAYTHKRPLSSAIQPADIKIETWRAL